MTLFRDGQIVSEGEQVDNDKVFTVLYDNLDYSADVIFSALSIARYIRIYP